MLSYIIEKNTSTRINDCGKDDRVDNETEKFLEQHFQEPHPRQDKVTILTQL